jgi:hypothetical protein
MDTRTFGGFYLDWRKFFMILHLRAWMPYSREVSLCQFFVFSHFFSIPLEKLFFVSIHYRVFRKNKWKNTNMRWLSFGSKIIERFFCFLFVICEKGDILIPQLVKNFGVLMCHWSIGESQ